MKIEIENERKTLVFIFKDKNIDFDFGMTIIKQLPLDNILFGEKRVIRKQEKYEVQTANLSLLVEVLPRLDTKQLQKCIYDIFNCINKMEESRMLVRDGLWCKYEHLFYDLEKQEIKFVVLPVSEALEYEDGLTWKDRLSECVNYIAGYLPLNLRKPILTQVDNLKEILKITREQLKIEEEKPIDRILSLIYIDNTETIEYVMKKSEVVVGKDEMEANVRIISSEAVSRLHCKIIKQNQSFFVQDLDSLNHTYVNGEFVPAYELMELEDRDIIMVGDMELRVNIS